MCLNIKSKYFRILHVFKVQICPPKCWYAYEKNSWFLIFNTFNIQKEQIK